MDGLPCQGRLPLPAHDAACRGVHAPLPASRPALRLAPHPPLQTARPCRAGGEPGACPRPAGANATPGAGDPRVCPPRTAGKPGYAAGPPLPLLRRTHARNRDLPARPCCAHPAVAPGRLAMSPSDPAARPPDAWFAGPPLATAWRCPNAPVRPSARPDQPRQPAREPPSLPRQPRWNLGPACPRPVPAGPTPPLPQPIPIAGRQPSPITRPPAVSSPEAYQTSTALCLVARCLPPRRRLPQPSTLGGRHPIRNGATTT